MNASKTYMNGLQAEVVLITDTCSAEIGWDCHCLLGARHFFKGRGKRIKVYISMARVHAGARRAQSLFQRLVFHKTQSDLLLETYKPIHPTTEPHSPTLLGRPTCFNSIICDLDDVHVLAQRGTLQILLTRHGKKSYYRCLSASTGLETNAMLNWSDASR